MYSLSSLPYAYDALEPYIDTRTMEIHHTKHQQAYVDGLNKTLESYPELQQIPLVELLLKIHDLPAGAQLGVRNHGGGHANHSFFWPLMKHDGGGMPQGKLAQAINKKFGSFEQFQEQFNAAAKSRFGSGWAWLSMNQQGDLEIHSTANQDSPFMEQKKPIMGLDVWEHAYYLKYQNRRVDYIAAWWKVLDWEHIEENYRLVS